MGVQMRQPTNLRWRILQENAKVGNLGKFKLGIVKPVVGISGVNY